MNNKFDGFVENQGVKIHYLAKNNGAQKMSLLFVPGVTMPAWIWENQLEYFSKYYRVVAMEPRSQGESDQCSEGNNAYSMAKDIKAVVDTLKLGPLILIGWSLAVPEVVNYAVHFASEQLKGLVLVDGLLGIDPNVSFYNWIVDFWDQLQKERIQKTKEFVRMIFKQPRKEEYYDKLFEAAMRTPTNTVMTLMNNYILQDFRPLLPKIGIPTMIITVDGPLLEYMKTMHKLIPHSRFETVENADHAMFVDQPEIFNRILEEFISDLKAID